jgi:hypothetical protein
MTDKSHDSGPAIAQDALIDLSDSSGDDRLSWIIGRRQEIVVEREALLAEDDRLWTEARQIRAQARLNVRPEDVPSTPSSAWTTPSRPAGVASGGWRPERVRDLLLWLGGALVALSVLSLVAVLWSRDQPAGKPLLTAPRLAVILLLATLVTAVTTRLIARRLPATAEVTATLVLALALTDWFVIRRAGVGDEMSVIGWMAIGSAVVAAIALAERSLFKLRSPLVTAPLLGVAALGSAAAPLAHASWTMAVTAAFCALVCVVAASAVALSSAWRPARVVVLTAAVVFTLAAVAAVFVAVGELADGTGDHSVNGAVVAVLSLTLPFAAVLLLERRRLAEAARVRDVIVGCVTLAALGAVGVVLATRLSAVQCLAALAWVGAGTIVVGRVARRLGWGVVVAGLASLGVGSALTIARTMVAVFAPWGWWSEPWSLPLRLVASDHLTPTSPPIFHDWWWAVVAALAVVATGAAVAVLRSSRPLRLPAVIVAVFAAGLTAVYLLPMAAGLTVVWVLVIELLCVSAAIVLAAAADRRRPGVAVAATGLAVVVASTASGWAIAAESGTIACVATIAATAALAATVASTPRFRRAMVALAAVGGIATVGTIVAAVTNRPTPSGVAIGVTAALALFAATTIPRARSAEFEGAAIISLVAGVSITATAPTALAGVLTAAAVSMVGGVLGGGAFAHGRRTYQFVLPIVAATAIDAWLFAAGVSVVEAYTIPIAASLLIAGVLLRHWDPAIGSWPAYVPGLAVALVPSLLVSLDRGGTVRVVALVAASTIVLVAGTRRRLQAPMLVAAAVLLTLAADALKPAAVGLPRWIPLGATGLLILWVGATFERRMKNLRRVRRTIRTFH